VNKLTRIILENEFPPVFTAVDVRRLEPDDNVRYCQMRRAMDSGDIIRLQRGLYTLNVIFRKEAVNEFLLANQFNPYSYISLETALWLEGWIPEYTGKISSVTSRSSASVKNTIGSFSYTHIPQKNLFIGVRDMFFEQAPHRQAKPLKALADCVYDHNYTWISINSLVDSLPIKPGQLETLTALDFDEIQGNYESAPFVETFLGGIRNELQV
jgi:predicted transcriptional regulator of viral defense system